MLMPFIKFLIVLVITVLVFAISYCTLMSIFSIGALSNMFTEASHSLKSGTSVLSTIITVLYWVGYCTREVNKDND